MPTRGTELKSKYMVIAKIQDKGGPDTLYMGDLVAIRKLPCNEGKLEKFVFYRFCIEATDLQITGLRKIMRPTENLMPPSREIITEKEMEANKVTDEALEKDVSYQEAVANLKAEYEKQKDASKAVEEALKDNVAYQDAKSNLEAEFKAEKLDITKIRSLRKVMITIYSEKFKKMYPDPLVDTEKVTRLRETMGAIRNDMFKKLFPDPFTATAEEIKERLVKMKLQIDALQERTGLTGVIETEKQVEALNIASDARPYSELYIDFDDPALGLTIEDKKKIFNLKKKFEFKPEDIKPLTVIRRKD